MKQQYFLIQEWLGNSLGVCGVYETVKDFINDYKKNLEKDGSMKFVKFETPPKSKKLGDFDLVIYGKVTKEKDTYPFCFITKIITINTII